MTTLLLIHIAIGVLFAVLAIPLIQRRVPPNPIYGFRVPKTLRDPEVWYPANAYSGKLLLWYGFAVIAAAVVLYVVPGLDENSYLIVLTVFVLGGLFLILWKSLRFIRDL